MDTFSLEDDGNELFVTQEARHIDVDMEKNTEYDDSVFGIEADDFSEPLGLAGNVNEGVPHYSDISRDEVDFQKPTFQ